MDARCGEGAGGWGGLTWLAELERSHRRPRRRRGRSLVVGGCSRRGEPGSPEQAQRGLRVLVQRSQVRINKLEEALCFEGRA